MKVNTRDIERALEEEQGYVRPDGRDDEPYTQPYSGVLCTRQRMWESTGISHKFLQG